MHFEFPLTCFVKAFDSLLGDVALQIRKLVDKNPKRRKQIYKRSKEFAKNLDELLQQLIYGTDTHENGRGKTPLLSL